MQDYTSIALFGDDVERLLRDLYGDLQGEAVAGICNAVLSITEQFVRYVRPDLWEEHRCAKNYDYMFAIGVPEGCGIGYSEWAAGMLPEMNSGSAFGRFDLILSHLESTPMSLCAFVKRSLRQTEPENSALQGADEQG